MPNTAAVILPDNTIAAVIMADASVDTVPPGYVSGAILVAAPIGCDEAWSYDPALGFKAPPLPVYKEAEGKVDF